MSNSQPASVPPRPLLRSIMPLATFFFGVAFGVAVPKFTSEQKIVPSAELPAGASGVRLSYPLSDGVRRHILFRVDRVIRDTGLDDSGWIVSLIQSDGSRTDLVVHPLDRTPGALPPDAAP